MISLRSILRSPAVQPARIYRTLATADTSGINEQAKPKTKRKKTVFSDSLNKGPSFEDFVNGKAADMLVDPLEAARQDPNQRLPKWLKVPIPKGKSFNNLKNDVRELKLATVCEEAKCPNIGECWEERSRRPLPRSC